MSTCISTPRATVLLPVVPAVLVKLLVLLPPALLASVPLSAATTPLPGAAMAEPSRTSTSETHQLLAEDSDDSAKAPADSLRRGLGDWDAVAIVVSVIVGSGIFASPGIIVDTVGSVGLGLLSWVIAGVLATASSLVYCELGAMMPSAGGDYTYLREAFGDTVAFSWAWVSFTVQKPASLAIVSTVVGNYATTVVLGADDSTIAGESSVRVKIFATVYVIGLTAINVLPITCVAKLQDGLALTKPVLIGGLSVLALVYTIQAPSTAAANFGQPALWAGGKPLGMGPAIFAALWAFNGWSNLSFMAEEMIDPQRQLPRAIIGGMLLVVAVYLCCNLCYLAVLPAFVSTATVPSLATTPVAAVSTAEEAGHLLLPIAMAGLAPAAVAGLISISGIGSSNVTVMTGGRYLYSVARDGNAPKAMARLSRWQTPYIALWAQAVAAIALCWLPGSALGSLMSYFGVSSWLYYLGTALALLKLRRDKPDAVMQRPYKAPLSCVVVCCVASLLLIGSTFISQPLPTIGSLGFCVLSYPVKRALDHCGSTGTGSGRSALGTNDNIDLEDLVTCNK